MAAMSSQPNNGPPLAAAASITWRPIDSPADESAATSIAARAFSRLRTIYQPTAAAVQGKSAESPAYDRLIGECDGRMAATVEYRVVLPYLHVRGLAVDPEFERRGFARAAMDQLSRIARVRGCAALRLFTIRETGNVAFFEHLGFNVVSQSPADWCTSAQFATLTEVELERPVAG